MAILDKICFVDYTMETCAEIKSLIDDCFILREFPTKPELKYTRFDGAEKIVKLTKCKQKITKEKKKECYEAFEIFMKGEDDRIRDEVGKLVAISGATLSQREEQLYILRQTFANKNN